MHIILYSSIHVPRFGRIVMVFSLFPPTSEATKRKSTIKLNQEIFSNESDSAIVSPCQSKEIFRSLYFLFMRFSCKYFNDGQSKALGVRSIDLQRTPNAIHLDKHYPTIKFPIYFLRVFSFLPLCNDNSLRNP